MEIQVVSLDGKKSGSVKLADEIFGLEPRADLLHRCVNWQLAKRQRGTHKTKGRSEISRTGKKMYSQKGTGQARPLTHRRARARSRPCRRLPACVRRAGRAARSRR